MEPECRLKLLCSCGGRILPRPSDGLLRYVGGETRVLSVPRSISFTDLHEKIAFMFGPDLLLKYPLSSEDLDALISVKTDEDLRHMIDEYDRPRSPAASSSSSRFRLFLFPPPAFDRRRVDAVGAGGGMPRARSTPNLGGGGGGGGAAPAGSPRARQRYGYCGCNCGCACSSSSSSSQLVRKCVCSPTTPGGSPLGSLAEASPPRKGSQGFQFGAPPPSSAGSSRRVVWE